MTGPRYVERGGDLVLCHPIACNHTTMYTWLVEADWDALSRLCDHVFTQPSGGKVVVRPLLPLVAVVAAEIRHGQATTRPASDKGWCPEHDLGFWVPCARGHMDGDRFEVEQSDQVVERRVSGIHAGHIIAARSFTSVTASVFATPLT